MVDKLEQQRIRRRIEALKKLGFDSKYNKNSKEDMYKFIFTDDNGKWYKSERNFKSVFPDIYEDICAFVSDTDINFTSFCQKLYNYTLNDGYAGGRQDLNNIGSADGYFISEGYAIPITWEKSSRSAQTVYKVKATGEELVINDGNTFIQIQPQKETLTIE